MPNIFTRWYQRNFSNPQAVALAMILIIGFTTVLLLGDILSPLFIAIVFAYLLEWLVQALHRFNLSRNVSVTIVFSGFMTTLLLTVFLFIPIVAKQSSALLQDVPSMVQEGQLKLQELPKQYPNYISEQQVSDIIDSARSELAGFGQTVLSASLSSLIGIMTLLIYLILVPLLVFFLMKDKQQITHWLIRWLPEERTMSTKVWLEVNSQIGNYVRGKVLEIIIVGAVTYAVFKFMGLNYALLLSVLVGFSVLIPYIGAAVVTLPIAVIGYFQFGFSPEFGYLMLAYGIIQALDGNVLVPILFSEAVNLHPIAIISAVLLFGGIWGFWGVFFAIPLATLVKAVLNAWQEGQQYLEAQQLIAKEQQQA